MLILDLVPGIWSLLFAPRSTLERGADSFPCFFKLPRFVGLGHPVEPDAIPLLPGDDVEVGVRDGLAGASLVVHHLEAFCWVCRRLGLIQPTPVRAIQALASKK